MMSAVLKMDRTEEALNTLRSLSPEAEEGMNRVKVEILYDLPGISIEAQDSRALRAAVNSYLRWTNVTEDINKILLK